MVMVLLRSVSPEMISMLDFGVFRALESRAINALLALPFSGMVVTLAFSHVWLFASW